MCNSSADCNSHGDCFSNVCYCDAGWFESDCTINLETSYREAFYLYIVFFVVTFSFIALYSIKGFNDNFKERKINDYRRGCSFFLGTILSPQSVCITMTLVFCIVKILWLLIDPFEFKVYVYYSNRNQQIISRQVERTLDEVGYSILFSIYGTILIVWYTIYDEISFNIRPHNSEPKRNCIVFKLFMKSRMFCMYVLQIGSSIIKGYRLDSQYRYYTYCAYAVLYINFILFIFEFLFYGSALYKLIDKMQQDNLKIHKENEQKFQQTKTLFQKSRTKKSFKAQLSAINVGKDRQSDLINSPSSLSHSKSLYISQEMQESETVPNNVGSNINLNEEEVDTYRWKHDACEQFTKDQRNQVKMIKERKLKEELQKNRRKTTNEEIEEQQVVRLTSMLEENRVVKESQYTAKRHDLEADKRVLKQIITLIFVGVALEIAFAIISIIVYSTTLLQNPEGTLVIYYVIGLLELASLSAVLKLFTAVKSKEVENLRWIQKIGTKNQRVSKKSAFELPKNWKENDPTKVVLESRINF